MGKYGKLLKESKDWYVTAKMFTMQLNISNELAEANRLKRWELKQNLESPTLESEVSLRVWKDKVKELEDKA